MRERVLPKRGVALAAAVAILFLSGCDDGEEPLRRTATALDTVATVTLYGTRDESLLDGCFSLIEKYEELFSATRPDSDVARINGAGGAWVTVNEETRLLLEEALRFCEESDGAFDITVRPAVELWNFSAERPTVPDGAALAEAATHIDYRFLELRGDRARLTDPRAGIDLGGVAKGYIADRLGDYLRERGAPGAIVNLGGNVLTVGDKGGKPFSVGIRDPFDGNKLLKTLSVKEGSVVTSGSYERGFEIDGVRYHHILDPADGKPVRNGLISVTVRSKRSVDGDMLSTACFVMGEERGLAWIESLKDTEALFVREDGTQKATDGFFD